MSSPAPPSAVAVNRTELLWLTIGAWVGGVFILTLAPVLLIPRLGIPMGMAVSYLVFFIVWHPVQRISQRLLGMGAAVIRMILFVASAAIVAFYLRESLLALSRG